MLLLSCVFYLRDSYGIGAFLVVEVVVAHLRYNVAYHVLDRVVIKQYGRLFERQVLRLDDEEVDKDKLKGQPAAVHDLEEYFSG